MQKAKNNKKFWEEYNNSCLKRLSDLLDKDFLLCDFHMHSNYSSDGKQSLEDIINNASSRGFDIISITDHDDVRVYDELYDYIQGGKLPQKPIIITGIEHTTSYPEYGTMCHILKHFINPKDENILRDIKIVEDSYYNRAQIQIRRIYESGVLSKIIKDNHLAISYPDFLQYLTVNNTKPDYATLIDYLADKFKTKNINTAQLFQMLYQENEQDECEERRLKKKKRFDKLLEKYKDIDVQDNRRFMLSILAVRDVDDDKYQGYKSSGSLSVNEYGQVDIFKLNTNGVTTFAHPTEASLPALYNCSAIGGKLIGIENNCKNKYANFSQFERVKNDMDLIELKGSDCHSLKENVYDDIDFYKISAMDLRNYITRVKEILRRGE